jgi:cellulose synthase/poly-beta-1,6-N-acetylglucosamine synthase-like glycosyltransferase
MWLFYLFAALLLCQSLLSLRGGFRYLAYFRRELARPPADYAPRATVFVPCRGVDQDLRENLDALFRQDYPAYELVFVTDDARDPALKIVEAAIFGFALNAATRDGSCAQDEGRASETVSTKEVAPSHAPARLVPPRVSARIVVAGRARACGQKVHNLRAAVGSADPASRVFVFVDTDARTRRDWLRSLVAPLADDAHGATTGYRWFLPARARLASTLRAVWNASIASALGDDARRNFCWGGSTAIRRETFEQLKMLDEWRGALSDDYAMTRALQRARLPIKFVPACLNVSYDDCTWRELFEFTTRQLKITRVYAPRLWLLVLASNLIFCSVFFTGILLAIARALRGGSFALTLSLITTVFIVGALKSALRLRAVNLVLAREGARVRSVARLAHLALWTLTSALFLWNALAAALSRRLTWRGISYELKSPTETVVIKRTTTEEAR